MNDLRTQLSQDLFQNGEVPSDLLLLWAAQEEENTELLDAYELVLISGLSAEEIVAPFQEDVASDPAAVAALLKFLHEVTFFAEALDGMVLGYWTHTPDSQPVVISFDESGQLSVVGRTVSEALVALTNADDEDEAAEVVAMLGQLGIRPNSCDVASVNRSLDGVPEPNEVVLGYLLEERVSRENS